MRKPAYERIQEDRRVIWIDRSFSNDHSRPHPYYRFEAKEDLMFDYQGKPLPNIPGMYWVKNFGDGHHEGNLHATVYNKALAKLDDKLTLVENLFEAWYERKEAYTMIGSAARGLVDFATNWRKPSFWKRVSKKALKPKTMPEAWLTYQFGIKPMVSSIDSALHLLGQPFPMVDVSWSERHPYKLQQGSWMQPGNILYHEGELRYTLGCKATIQNANSYISNALGLTTPFSTAFSVIPWGWAIDYFVNVSDILKNFEVKHPGITISDQYTTCSIKDKWYGQMPPRDELVYSDFPWPGMWYKPVPGPSAAGSAHFTHRYVGEHKYKLAYSYPSLGSNQFANLFSAIALAMQGAKK